MATKTEREHMDGTASLGCVQCLFDGTEGTPAELHHCGTYGGGSRDHMKIAPLCPEHHRFKLAIDKQGKLRRFIEAKYLDYVAMHCACASCKRARARGYSKDHKNG